MSMKENVLGALKYYTRQKYYTGYKLEYQVPKYSSWDTNDDRITMKTRYEDQADAVRRLARQSFPKLAEKAVKDGIQEAKAMFKERHPEYCPKNF